MLGFPPEQLPQLADWTLDFVGCLAPTATAERLEDGKVAAARLVEAFVAHTGRAELDSLVANRIGYLSQACEATAGLIGNTLLALGRYPDVLARVTTDRAFLVAVVREVVRHDAPVQNTRRFVAESGTIAGQAMREGDAVLVVLAAANRDPAANADGGALRPASQGASGVHVQSRGSRLPWRDPRDADHRRRRRAAARLRRAARSASRAA